MFLFLLVVCLISCSGENDQPLERSPGDIMIGVLLPFHSKTNRTTVPGPVSCTDFDIEKFIHFQVIKYTIREINQHSPVRPTVTLGYDVYDTCGDVSLALRATLQLLKNQLDPQSSIIGSAPANFQTKAVIGETNSEVSAAIARVLALSSVAQISYASTSEVLSKKLKYPTFLRTISSDEYQTKAISELVRKFNWRTVAIIGSDDEYGKYGSERLEESFRETGVCIEFTEILNGHFSQNRSQTHSWLRNLVSDINKSTAEAIIIFTKSSNVQLIIEAAVKHRLNRTWIASDSWSTSTKIYTMPGIELAGPVYGFISERNEVPGFKDYIRSMFSRTTCRPQDTLDKYMTHCALCSNQSESRDTNSQEASAQCLQPSCLLKYMDQDASYNLYLAIKVIAEALSHLLKSDNQQYKCSTDFTTLELFKEIQKVNFTVGTTHMYFNKNGDPSLGYDIVQWNMDQSTRRIHVKTIGQYYPNKEIKLPEVLIRAMSSINVTVYNCSKTCAPGWELKQQGSDKCCKMCAACADGEFSHGNGEECESCGSDRYSSPQRDKCFNKTVEFLQWKDPFIIVLSSLGVLGMIVTIVFVVPFTIYRDTPIVKAVGGYLCFLELFSLLVCFCLTFSITGEPTVASCMVKMPVFGMTFSLCISCILANLLQILVGFKFDLNTGSWMKKINQPVAVVTIVSGIQIAVCVPWMILNPPSPQAEKSSTTILQQCDKGSIVFFVVMLSYNAFWAFFCFLFAFQSKQLPDLYKNASLITISMLLFLIIWILYIPIDLYLSGNYKQVIESAAILISSYSILGCHLAPKCYIMVFRKEINNESAILEYIRKHYEQKGIAVVRS